MKQILIAIVVIVAAVAAFKYWDRYRTGDVNRGRVEAMLRSMAEKDEQTSLCLWALNKVVLDRDTMNAYYDRYLRFVSASGLDGSSGWAVADAKPSGDGRATIVTVRGNDRSVVLRVSEGLPIELQQ
ncbi:MAG TPA: hypothetical protein VMT19_00900 [Thermoanaerobaculaceae bacterium]|nr:hypothetical protein [Thermoanaerobaculaceae bacterium]